LGLRVNISDQARYSVQALLRALPVFAQRLVKRSEELSNQ
jgi:hypothetical protein